MKVQYIGSADVRILNAKDFDKLEVKQGKVTWEGSDPQELDNAAGKALIEKFPDEFAEFVEETSEVGETPELVDDDELDDDGDSPEEPAVSPSLFG